MNGWLTDFFDAEALAAWLAEVVELGGGTASVRIALLDRVAARGPARV